MKDRDISRSKIFRSKMQMDYKEWEKTHKRGGYPNVIDKQRMELARNLSKKFATKYNDDSNNGKEPGE